MKDFQRSVRRSVVAVVAVLLSAGPASAQDLPAAQELLSRYRAAIGADALKARQSVHRIGEFSLPAMGISAPFESWSARPNRSAVKIEIPGFGEFRRGHTGAVAWAVDPMEGPRVLTGAQLLEAEDDAAFESTLRAEALVESATTVERTTLAGRDCYKVKLVWKSGRETHDCYSAETGLLVGSMSVTSTPMGEIESVALFDDYRDFGGVTMAARVTVQVLGNEQVMTLREVHFDQVPESVFEAPAEIQALVRE